MQQIKWDNSFQKRLAAIPETREPAMAHSVGYTNIAKPMPRVIDANVNQLHVVSCLARGAHADRIGDCVRVLFGPTPKLTQLSRNCQLVGRFNRNLKQF